MLLGVEALLVNCIPTTRVLDYLHGFQDLGVMFGAYPNAGRADDGVGFAADPADVQSYVEAVQQWIEAGARIVGGCCGMGVDHIKAARASFGPA